MNHRILAITAITLTAYATTASAQTPYSAKKMSISDLIQPAVYERVPIQLLEHTPTHTNLVMTDGRLNFESSYDVPYWDLVNWFEAQRKARKSVSTLDPEAFPNAQVPELVVLGTATVNEGTKFTLGAVGVPYQFDILIRPDDRSRAVVVVRNAMYSLIFSGGVPARAPFKPAGKAQEIRFRWN